MVEDVWGWRAVSFGPETPGYVATVMVRTDVQWCEIGLSVRWDSDEDSHNVQLRAGPLGAYVTVGRSEVLPELPEDGLGLYRGWRVGGKDLHLFSIRRHLGAKAGWARMSKGLAVRVEVGPVGFVMEPVW